ncbi:CopD family protein [Hyphococcus flavus]|uniref:CopD family protein n=1 Tax=Hyphococcus flavus TaxID=1866326 RepID=A0AAE9ZE28_9PROT|nr:CopD family protein [Hyphococcus flavus]WDI31970.1 CopD family protein [Hyphococcus flavus]
MPDAISFFAFVVQFGYYAASLMFIGALVGCATGVKRTLGVSASAALALAVLGFYAARLLLANAKLGGTFAAAVDSETFPWIWRIYKLQAFAIILGSLSAFAAALLGKRLIMLTAALILSAGFGLAGHTQGLESLGVMPWLAGFHVLVAGFWFAAPAALWPAAAIDDKELVRRLEAFSRIAQFAIPALFAAGLVLAWRLAEGWDGLTGSAYGRLLFAKLTAASIALALGAYNKMTVTRRIKADHEAGRKTLRFTLAAEFALFLIATGLIAFATTVQGPET